MGLVRSQREGAVATLTLDRPEARNALSAEMCDDLVGALEYLDRNEEVRVVVLRGAGEVFCAGADLSAVVGERALGFMPTFTTMLDRVARHRLPTVAAIHGAALGGGLQLAVACDFRIVIDEARLAIPSSRLGIVVDLDNVERLVLLTGAGAAKELLMAGSTLSGAEAATAGLATRSVRSDSFEDAVRDYAQAIAELAPLAVQGAKRAIQLVGDASGGVRRKDPDGARAIDDLVAQVYSSEDLAEGLRALAEKRRPRWQGR